MPSFVLFLVKRQGEIYLAGKSVVTLIILFPVAVGAWKPREAFPSLLPGSLPSLCAFLVLGTKAEFSRHQEDPCSPRQAQGRV